MTPLKFSKAQRPGGLGKDDLGGAAARVQETTWGPWESLALGISLGNYGNYMDYYGLVWILDDSRDLWDVLNAEKMGSLGYTVYTSRTWYRHEIISSGGHRWV